MVSRKKLTLIVGSGLLLTLAVMSLFGFEEVLLTIFAAKWHLLAVAAAIHLVIVGVLASRLFFISKKYTKISFQQAFKITFIGLFVNLITPVAKFGGEPVKIQMLRKNVNGSKATAIIAMDSMAELLSSVVFFLAILVLYFNKIPGALVPYMIIFLIIFGLVIATLLKISLSLGILKKILNFTRSKISRFVKVGEKDYATLFHSSYKDLMKDNNVMMSSISLSVLVKFLEILRFYFILLSINVVLPFSSLAIIWNFMLILFIIPWLPGGLGLVETGVAFSLITFGLAPSSAATSIILDRFISFWLVFFIGIFVTSKYIAEIRKVRKKIK